MYLSQAATPLIWPEYQFHKGGRITAMDEYRITIKLHMSTVFLTDIDNGIFSYACK